MKYARDCMYLQVRQKVLNWSPVSFRCLRSLPMFHGSGAGKGVSREDSRGPRNHVHRHRVWRRGLEQCRVRRRRRRRAERLVEHGSTALDQFGAQAENSRSRKPLMNHRCAGELSRPILALEYVQVGDPSSTKIAGITLAANDALPSRWSRSRNATTYRRTVLVLWIQQARPEMIPIP
jgi:hypothetical protein